MSQIRASNKCGHGSSIARRNFVPKGQLAGSGDIWVVITGGGVYATVISWVRAKDDGPTTKRYPAPRVSSAEVEEARLVGLSAIVVDVPLYKREGWCVV